MQTFLKNKIRALTALLVALASLAPMGVPVQAAAITINLCAVPGTLAPLPATAAATTIPVWGFMLNPGACPTTGGTLPGPVLSVTEGDVVTINVTNALPAGHTLTFEIPGITFDPGPTDAAVGATVSRTFTATASGTYLYQSGGDAGRQEAMGLYGALIVRPTTANQAYAAAATAYDVESILVLSQVDPNFNASPDTFDMYTYQATYWMINGRAYPDTLPISATGGQRVLLRYLNAGNDNTTMLLLGMHENVLARDARLLNNPFFASADTIPAGATEDTIAVVPSTAAPGAHGFALYNRQDHLTNGLVGSANHTPGGMMTFITNGVALASLSPLIPPTPAVPTAANTIFLPLVNR